MTVNGIIQILLFFGLVLALAKPLGLYMARVFARERTFLDPVLAPIERLIYRLSGVKPDVEQHWTTYTIAMLLFNVAGLLVLYADAAAPAPSAAESAGARADLRGFLVQHGGQLHTNTNWQSYVPESTMSYFTQMVGLTFHNFVSAATGIALAIALVRGFARHEGKTIGNFWVDLTRCTLWILLPICLLVTPILVWQGVPQNLNAYTAARPSRAPTRRSRKARRVAGGDQGARHQRRRLLQRQLRPPLREPHAAHGSLEMLLIFSISAALTYTFGVMVRDTRQGWALLAVMAAILVLGVFVAYWSEAAGNPAFARLGVDPGGRQHGGQGGPLRYRQLRAVGDFTTGTSCGAVNSMHDSFTPLGGLIPLTQHPARRGRLSAASGAGLYGMLVFAVLSVFIAGLMVGRTPEYLGKKIEAKEVTMAVLGHPHPRVLDPRLHRARERLARRSRRPAQQGAARLQRDPLRVLVGHRQQRQRLRRALREHGLLQPDDRSSDAVRPLPDDRADDRHRRLAGEEEARAAVERNVSDHTPLFVALLVGVILIVGGLTFFPALALGPIVDHLFMMAGKTL